MTGPMTYDEASGMPLADVLDRCQARRAYWAWAEGQP